MLRSSGRLIRVAALCATISVSSGDGAGQAIADARGQELASVLPARPQQYANTYLSASLNEHARWAAVYRLAAFTEAAEFLMYAYEREPSARVRFAIIDVLGTDRRWSDLPSFERVMRHAALNDADWRIARNALEALRQRRMMELRDLLAQRIRTDQRDGAHAGLVDLDDRFLLHERGAMLPAFMRRREGSVAIEVPSSSVRIVAFGDYGAGTKEQALVASTIRGIHERRPFTLGLTLGDNFYVEDGIQRPDDTRLQRWWEELYAPLQIPFFASLGNHDWNDPDMPATEIAFGAISRNWRMPATYYAFTAGPVQFVALDTNTLSEAQLLWLDRVLERRHSVWTIVYGHHPIYFSDPRRDRTDELVTKLLPLLVKHRVDLYMSGHHHSLQHIRGDLPLDLVIAGGGGNDTYPVAAQPSPRVTFAASAFGCAVIDASPRLLTIALVNQEGRVLHRIERAPHGTASALAR